MAIYFRRQPTVVAERFALAVDGVMVSANLETHEQVCEEYRSRKERGSIKDTSCVQYFKKNNGQWHCYNSF